MLQFLVKNKQVAAMVGLLTVAALVAIILASRSGGYSIVDLPLQETDDISDIPWIFASQTLPSDKRFMPSIGNGQLATNIFSKTVLMNGLYNGKGGESRRARIPAWSNVRLHSTMGHLHYSPVYSLDTKKGVFQVHVDRERSIVNQRIYAHRYYTNTIVNQILITSKQHVDPNYTHQVIWIELELLSGKDSEDIAFSEPVPDLIDEHQVWSTCGQTRVSEDLNYQQTPIEVCAYWTAVPAHLTVPRHGSRTHTFAMTVAHNRTAAKSEFVKVLQEENDDLFEKHIDEWKKLHYQGLLNIEGNLRLAKIIHGIWYYFLSALPAENSNQPLGLFYGMSPTGLAGGKNFEEYEGHNLWDSEIWMFPPILLLYPKYAEKLLRYRLEMAPIAADIARENGNQGYRYPWESAYTGREVTQPCCPHIAELEQHITADIAFAVRQYLAVTKDEKWLKNGGCALVTNIADFWASRAKINYSTGFYDIANVMGPDEDHANVTNSAYTNVVAGYSLYLAQYVACLCQSYYATKDPDNWADIAWGLALPYDEAEDYHPQFEGYKRREEIKQADVVLLGYPLQYPMKESTRTNDLSYYESVTRSDGPAMTWSMHTIGHLQINDNLGAARLFNKSYLQYVREPFKIWSELQRPKVGATNFYTGMGGFLQALLFGYAGISIHLDRLEIKKPQLPPEATRFEIKGIKYLGANMTLDIHLAKTTLKIISTDRRWPLMLVYDSHNIILNPGVSVLEGPASDICQWVQHTRVTSNRDTNYPPHLTTSGQHSCVASDWDNAFISSTSMFVCLYVTESLNVIFTHLKMTELKFCTCIKDQ